MSDHLHVEPPDDVERAAAEVLLSRIAALEKERDEAESAVSRYEDKMTQRDAEIAALEAERDALKTARQIDKESSDSRIADLKGAIQIETEHKSKQITKNTKLRAVVDAARRLKKWVEAKGRCDPFTLGEVETLMFRKIDDLDAQEVKETKETPR